MQQALGIEFSQLYALHMLLAHAMFDYANAVQLRTCLHASSVCRTGKQHQSLQAQI